MTPLSLKICNQPSYQLQLLPQPLGRSVFVSLPPVPCEADVQSPHFPSASGLSPPANTVASLCWTRFRPLVSYHRKTSVPNLWPWSWSFLLTAYWLPRPLIFSGVFIKINGWFGFWYRLNSSGTKLNKQFIIVYSVTCLYILRSKGRKKSSY